MKIVMLDAYTTNPGDLSWDFMNDFGDVTIYDRTPTDKILERVKDADIVITNKTPLTKETIDNIRGEWYIIFSTWTDGVLIPAR